jgi:pSer/pThr/pTyr-binding forkhead associated (FHA) protein
MTVSRRHAVIERDAGDQLLIRDLGSLNVPWVD